MREKVNGVVYSLPEVILLQDTGIGTSEFAARTAYDSFENSENDCIRELNSEVNDFSEIEAKPDTIKSINDIESSNILDDLAWTYFHHSVLEHASLTFLIKGMSRGTLQELVRHRIASYTVRSTRYTMSGIINAFVASKKEDTINQLAFFKKKLSTMDFLVTELEYNEIEFASIFSKLDYQFSNLNSEFYELALTKSNLGLLKEKDMSSEVLFSKLQNSKKKRNIGDAFKHIVSDNWKVDLVMTINIRSLKNFLVLRDSGAAWFQIRWLAQAIKEVTPNKYLDLIIKRNKK